MLCGYRLDRGCLYDWNFPHGPGNFAVVAVVLEFGNEAVAFSGDRLYEVGPIGVFVQRGADLAKLRC